MNELKNMKAFPASQYNPGWNLAIDLNNMIIVCEAVARSALERCESRGGHTRLDFPEERKECITFNTIIKKNGNNIMQIKREERQAPPEDLYKIAFSDLEDLENV